MGLKLALSGATGFIARRLVAQLLAEGHELKALTRRSGCAGLPAGVTLVRGDVTGEDAALIELLDGADVFFHCAAELRDPARMEAVNVTGTERLLRLAAGRIGRWVQLSSVGVYGHHGAGDITEETPLAPENPYERSKAKADRLVAEGAARGGFEFSILRPSIVFGEEMPNQSLRQLAEAIRRGVFFFLGAPGASANYIHVENVVHALGLCARHSGAAGRVFNLSDYRSMEAFVETIAAAQGIATPTIRLPVWPVRLVARVAGSVPGNPLTVGRVDALTGRTRYPVDRICRELGYAHVLSMEDGVQRTMDAFFPGSRNT